MSAEEEREVVMAWKADPRPEYVDRILRAHAKLVLREVNRHRASRCDPADLFQEACMGVMRSLHNYDPDRGIRLMTYSIWWLRVYVSNFILKTRSLVWHADRKVPSVDVRIRNTQDTPEPGYIDLDSLGRDTENNPEDQALRAEEFLAVTTALATLEPREQEILGRRLVTDTTLREIGVSLQITKERVRQIEAQAIKRVRSRMVG